MKAFATTFQAIDKTDGILKTFVGQTIFANSHKEATEIVTITFPWLSILGDTVSEIDYQTGQELIFNQN